MARAVSVKTRLYRVERPLDTEYYSLYLRALKPDYIGLKDIFLWLEFHEKRL